MPEWMHNIPKLPTAPVKCTESIPCPWCRCDQQGSEAWRGVMTCTECDLDFEVLEDADSDGLVTQGVRSETDRKYMDAMGVTEAMAFDAHSDAD